MSTIGDIGWKSCYSRQIGEVHRLWRRLATMDKKRRVCAVGTTAMRAIESSVSSNARLNAFDGWTHKFIFPPYDFSIANAMITNFHTPKSTLLMMVSAFAGYERMMTTYQYAIDNKYRFFSYGDAMFLSKKESH
mgnify:CR=1 FL=1